MGLRHSSSPLSLRSATIVTLALAALSACSLTKKEDDAGAAANATAAVVMPAAPVFNVNTPQGTQPAEAAPAAVQPGVVTATGKTKPSTSTTPSTATGTGGTAARATTIAAAAQGGTNAATTARATATGGATTKAATTAAPAAVPQVDMACVNSCGTKLQACITAAGLDGTKLAACQNVLTTCQAECKK
jgi:hypothetical protein